MPRWIFLVKKGGIMNICEGSGHEDQSPAIRIQQQQLRSARQYRLVFQDQVRYQHQC
jgi:hypothetical protein